ncbi:MAG: hypothetical protein HZC17_07165 [Candidatus Omnitrophica bacterium]|nr:hypothetical protein [Candidatus Omnitrophota bacterium]
MIKSMMIFAFLTASLGTLVTGCETANKYAEDPFSPITTPAKPLITPINDTVEDVVAVHKIKPAGLDTTVSIADQKQVTIAF